MRRLQLGLLGVAGALFATCLITAAAVCPALRCASGGALSAPRSVVAAVLLVVALLAVAMLLRAGWLAWRGKRHLATLPTAQGHAANAAHRRFGDQALLTGGASVAFCAGLLRPQVYLSLDVVDALDDEELEAVLIHERCHAAHRDPLRRVLRKALADVLWFAPVVAWWAEQRLRREEVAADAEAVRQVGKRPVAGALVKLWTSSAGAVTSAAYGDAASARVASLLGDRTGQESMPRRLVLLSLAGSVASLPLAVCFASLIV